MHRMRILTLATVVVVAATHDAAAQAGTDPVARHRAVYQATERDLARFRHAEASMDSLGLERQSTDGGRLQAWCDGDAIRLLVADYFGESGDVSERFYFDGDSLVFVFQQSRRGIPDGSTPYPRRTIVEEERLYLSGGRPVRWLGKGNRPNSPTSPAARARTKEALADATRLRATMPACRPRYAEEQ